MPLGRDRQPNIRRRVTRGVSAISWEWTTDRYPRERRSSARTWRSAASADSALRLLPRPASGWHRCSRRRRPDVVNSWDDLSLSNRAGRVVFRGRSSSRRGGLGATDRLSRLVVHRRDVVENRFRPGCGEFRHGFNGNGHSKRLVDWAVSEQCYKYARRLGGL